MLLHVAPCLIICLVDDVHSHLRVDMQQIQWNDIYRLESYFDHIFSWNISSFEQYNTICKLWFLFTSMTFSFQLEQLERLRSEDTTAASWLPIPLSHIGSQVKRRQSQSYKFKKFAKISNFWILKRALHATHLLKLLDKMCKYEMDPMSIVEDTERTRFCPQTDRRTDGRTDGQGDTSIPPYQLRWSGGYNKTTNAQFQNMGAIIPINFMESGE